MVIKEWNSQYGKMIAEIKKIMFLEIPTNILHITSSIYYVIFVSLLPAISFNYMGQ